MEQINLTSSWTQSQLTPNFSNYVTQKSIKAESIENVNQDALTENGVSLSVEKADLKSKLNTFSEVFTSAASSLVDPKVSMDEHRVTLIKLHQSAAEVALVMKKQMLEEESGALDLKNAAKDVTAFEDKVKALENGCIADIENISKQLKTLSVALTELKEQVAAKESNGLGGAYKGVGDSDSNNTTTGVVTLAGSSVVTIMMMVFESIEKATEGVSSFLIYLNKELKATAQNMTLVTAALSKLNEIFNNRKSYYNTNSIGFSPSYNPNSGTSSEQTSVTQDQAAGTLPCYIGAGGWGNPPTASEALIMQNKSNPLVIQSIEENFPQGGYPAVTTGPIAQQHPAYPTAQSLISALNGGGQGANSAEIVIGEHHSLANGLFAGGTGFWMPVSSATSKLFGGITAMGNGKTYTFFSQATCNFAFSGLGKSLSSAFSTLGMLSTITLPNFLGSDMTQASTNINNTIDTTSQHAASMLAALGQTFQQDLSTIQGIAQVLVGIA